MIGGTGMVAVCALALSALKMPPIAKSEKEVQ